MPASILIPFALLAACKKEEAPEVEVTVHAEHPEQGEISQHILTSAVLAPRAQAAIVPKITAPVKKFYVERGAHVKEGQLLATLENADLAAAAMDNKGTFEAAEAAYATATKAQVPEDAQKAELDYGQAKANLDLSTSIVNSRKELFAEGSIPGRDLDTAVAAEVQAQAAYDSAAKHLESVRSVSRDSALKAARGQLTSAEGKYKGSEAEISYSEIRSPIAGVVTERPLFAGETVAAGAALITIMDTSVLIAKAHVAESVAQQMKAGDKASVSVPGGAEPIKGEVVFISPALDAGSTTVEVWLRVGNKSGALKAGTPVKASVTGQTIEKAWKIPVSAVLTGQDGTKSVMLVGSDGKAHRKAVNLGITDGEDVQVTSGLAPGDTVITVGAYGLDDGAKVKVGTSGDDDAKSEDKGGEEK